MFDSDSEIDNEEISKEFKINIEYAQRFEHNKKREEKAHLEEKYKDYSSGTDSEDAVVEDSDGELITPQVDAQIMTTITMLRRKDKSIYDTATSYFKEDDLELAKKKWMEKKAAPVEKQMLLKDYHRRELLATGKAVSGDSRTFSEEQTSLKDAFKFAAAEQDDDNDLFTVRPDQEDDEDDEAYSSFLLSQMYKDQPEKQNWKDVKEDLEKDQEFLMDFLLHRGWVDKTKDKIPSYNDITLHDSTDDDEDDKVDDFETQYNFRYEEGGSEHVVTHARTIPGIIRRKDNTRVLKRQAEKEKKDQQTLKKQEELKRLKNLKREELAAKLKQIQDMAGGDLVGLDELDLDQEFDPSAHDKNMNIVFADGYYDARELKTSGKPKKPTWDDDIDISDLVVDEAEKKFPKKRKGRELDREDATQEEYPAQHDSESVTAAKTEIDKYMDEYYQMDYEDIVGGLPVRFKYRKVEPNSFSLKPEEILMADDADLNNVMSLKKLGPYRSTTAREKDDLKWKLTKKKKLWEFRAKLKGKEIRHTEEPAVDAGEMKRLKKEAKIDQSRLDSYSASATYKKAKKAKR